MKSYYIPDSDGYSGGFPVSALKPSGIAGHQWTSRGGAAYSGDGADGHFVGEEQRDIVANLP